MRCLQQSDTSRAPTQLLQVRVENPEAVWAWTLVELIGVLAVIVLLSAALVPLSIRHMDRIVADQEAATLNSFANALQLYVIASRTIPDQTTWYSAIAAKLGLGTNDVLYNPHQQTHQQPRIFLIDAALRAGYGTNLLPYYQTNFISSSANYPILPSSARVMIVSSLGKALPASIVSGALNTNYFSDLWNAAEGTVPSDAAWSGWNGDPADVIVRRINLSPLFVRLVMNKYNSGIYGYYTIDGIDGATVPTSAFNVDGYFIQGSVLSLYSGSSATNLDTKMILTADTSLVFEQGKWGGSLTGASAGSGAAGVDDVVQQFLNATPNTNAQNWSLSNQNTQQLLVVNDIFAYMSNYNVWAFSNNFSRSSPIYTYLKNFEPTMISDIQGLYLLNAGGGNSYYPTNPFRLNCP